MSEKYPGQQGRAGLVGGHAPKRRKSQRQKQESEKVVIPSKPSDARRGKAPRFRNDSEEADAIAAIRLLHYQAVEKVVTFRAKIMLDIP